MGAADLARQIGLRSGVVRRMDTCVSAQIHTHTDSHLIMGRGHLRWGGGIFGTGAILKIHTLILVVAVFIGRVCVV